MRLGVDEQGSTAAVAQLDGAITDLVDVATQAAAVVIGFSVAIGSLAVSAASAADDVDKGSQAAAISTDAYQELAFAASQSGTSIDTVTKALGKQTMALTQLADGTGPAADALTGLGLTYDELAAMTPDQQFEATATAIAGLASEQEQLAVATAIYGEDMAQQLLPMLSAGGDGIAAMRDEAQALGLVMGEDSVAAGVLFTDTLDQVLSVVGAIKNTVGLALVPALTDLLSTLREWYTANAQLIQQRVSEWAEVIAAGIGRLVSWFELANEVVQATLGGWEPILAGVALVIATVGAAAAALAGLKAWLAIQSVIAFIGTVGAATFGQLIAVILGVAAAVVGLVLIVDDLVTYFQGGQSAIGGFIEQFRDADGYLGAAARAMERLLEVGASVIGIVVQLGEIWWAVFSQTTLPVLGVLLSALMAVAELGLGAIAWWANTVVIPALDMLLQVLGAVGSGLSAVGGLLGIEVGGEAAAGATAMDTSAFAPALATSTSNASTSNNVEVQGSTYSISGMGVTMEELQAYLDERDAAQARQTAAALDGADA